MHILLISWKLKILGWYIFIYKNKFCNFQGKIPEEKVLLFQQIFLRLLCAVSVLCRKQNREHSGKPYVQVGVDTAHLM